MSTSLKGLKLKFGDAHVSLDLSAPVEGFDATVQCVLVNTGTSLGSDRVFPETRGTEVVEAGLLGKLFNIQAAAHVVNFGAVRTQEFIEEQTPADVLVRIRRLRIVPTSLVAGKLATNITIETTSGVVVGRTASI